jgi:predicted nucleic acid-binding protein
MSGKIFWDTNLNVAAAISVAEIRAEHSIKTPDAIQLACAKVCGAKLFITNDERLSKIKIYGLEILSLNGFVENILKKGNTK